MAASGYTPISIYHSTTASAVPVNTDLVNGELAINIADGKLYYKDSGGTVQVIASKATGTIGGSTTQVQYNSSGALAGSANFTFNGTTATINTLNLTNALGAAYGGTAQSTYTQGDLLYASAANTLSKLAIGSNTYILTSNGTIPGWAAPSSISVNTATNLAGGAGGSVPYQSGAGATTFLSIGTANQVMTSSGSLPQWSSGLSITTLTASDAVTFSATTQNIALGTSQTTGTFTVGGAAQTGTQTFDQSTKTHTLNLGTGATESGLTKTINLGTGGVATSTTAINIGSANGTTTTVSGAFVANGGAVFNENGADVDFRVEGDTDANLIFADASTDRVGIGTNTPGVKLDIAGNATVQNGVLTVGKDTVYDAFINSPESIYFNVDSDANSSGNKFTWGTDRTGNTGGTTWMTLDSSGNLGLGVTPSAWGTSSQKAIEVILGALSYRGAGNTESTVTHGAYYDGTNWKYAATSVGAARYQMIGANAGSSHTWSVSAGGTKDNTISFTQAMTLDASGNLLVGTTAAANKFVVRAAQDTGIEINSSDTNNSRFITAYDATNSRWYINSTFSGTGTTLPLAFLTGNTERARITSGGYFKASNDGTYFNSTGTYHELRQTANAQGVVVSATNASFTSESIFSTATKTAGTDWLHFYGTSDGNTVANIKIFGNGNVQNANNSYAGISDQKLKQDIVDAGSQWDDIKNLQVRKYRFKATPDAPLQIGLVAQEAETVSPGLVEETADRDSEGNDLGTTTKAVKYSVLYMKAIKALQEAMARIEKLEAEVAALKGA